MVDVLALQETHTTEDQQLPIAGYTVISYSHHKQYGLATYVRDDVPASELCSSSVDSNVYWNAIRIRDQTIVNVYKPPVSVWPSPALPPFPTPVLFCGDYNSQHTSWGYKRDEPSGTALVDWASRNDLMCLFDPKQPASFKSARWGTGTNPDLAFIDCNPAMPHAERRVLAPFPRSQHRPSLITTGTCIKSTNSSNKPRWNFKKANWEGFTAKLETLLHDFSSTPIQDFDKAYTSICDAFSSAAKAHIPRGSRKVYIPGWSDECSSLYDIFKESSTSEDRKAAADNLIKQLDTDRQNTWIESV